MKQDQKQNQLMQRLGHDFQNPDLLSEALTHSSLSSATRRDNQRLEFLGDRVLGLVISEALLELDANASEGDLAPRYNTMVRKETCAEIAAEIKLGDALMLGRSEMLSGGRRKLALLGDAMEAVIAAVYLDSDFDTTRRFIRRLWADRLRSSAQASRDGKTMLQEWAQARGMEPPTYDEVSRSGPDHAPIFTIKVTLEDGHTAEAQANSKRAAQQAAATALLEIIEND